jgi:phosphoserine phosphatase RsbU/P
MRILIAEDDLTSRAMLSGVLIKNGYEVVETANGLQALEALQQSDAPRIAVLDWLMPEIDGVEVVRRIRARETEQPPYLFLLTTLGGKSHIAEGLRAGADDYLVKPFEPVELIARVEVGCRLIAMQDRLSNKVLELRDALNQIKTLSGIVPICAGCKKIRDDQGYWNQVETYISAHSEAQFSHGLCPDCLKKYYPSIDMKDDEEGEKG